MNSNRNYLARVKAIYYEGLVGKYKAYAQEHKGYNRLTLANHFCKMHNVDWRKHL